jgi:hypothetical protein
MVLVGEVEPFVSDPRDDLADADIISSGGEDFGPFAAPRWLEPVRLASERVIRSRRARIIAVPVLAGLVVAATFLIPGSRRATSTAPPGQAGQPLLITNSTVGLGSRESGVFAGGTVDGRAWQLAVQDIADPRYRCLPGVSINGQDADPLFADPYPLRQSPVGDLAFVTLGAQLAGAGFAFIQVPADADSLGLGPADGRQFALAPVTVSVCGQRFRLAGFAYSLAATLRLHATFRDRPEGSYTVPAALSAPRGSPDDPQVDGVWHGPGAAEGPVASGTIASGSVFGVPWSIRVTFGKAGDCFSLSTSPPIGNGLWQVACGPISTPEGPSTVMVLPLGASSPGVVGVGYAVSVGAGIDHLTAELSDGENVSARPVVVDGRKYAAFFVPGRLRIFWLNWIDAKGHPIAGTTGLPGYGYIQFWPNGVPAIKTEAWSTGWST